MGMVGSLIPAVISRLAFSIWQAMDIEGGDGKHRSTSFTEGGVYPTWIGIRRVTAPQHSTD